MNVLVVGAPLGAAGAPARELLAALAADQTPLVPAARAGHGHCAH